MGLRPYSGWADSAKPVAGAELSPLAESTAPNPSAETREALTAPAKKCRLSIAVLVEFELESSAKNLFEKMEELAADYTLWLAPP
jgi:hypothetical protein